MGKVEGEGEGEGTRKRSVRKGKGKGRGGAAEGGEVTAEEKRRGEGVTPIYDLRSRSSFSAFAALNRYPLPHCRPTLTISGFMLSAFSPVHQACHSCINAQLQRASIFLSPQ